MQEINEVILKATNQAIKYIETNGFSFNEIKKFYWKRISFNKKDIYLRIVFPPKFPFKYPKFYVDQKEWYLKYPHIEKDCEYGCNICYIEDDNKVAIFDGEQLLEKELKKVYKIIEGYEKNTFNIKDFLNEFDSYWGDSYIYMDVQNIIEEPKVIGLLETSKLKPIVATNIKTTETMLKNLNLQIKKERRIIFLPFFDKFTYPFPITKNEILKIVNQLGYQSFLEKHIEQANLKVIFSFNIDTYTHYGAFIFSKPYKQYLFDPLIKQIMIKRVDRNRIFYRGGNEKMSNIAKNSIEVTIVGCGSLGGSLAFKLGKSGVKNFVFIDADSLKIDNIGRHMCGMRYLNMHKVDALKRFLLEQFPDLNIETISKNAIDCLDRIKKTGLIVSAVGSEGEGFEQLLLQMKHSKNKKINIPPIVLTWFESAIAGQIVLIKKTDIDDLPVFLKKISVLDESKKNQLTQLDTGCNSSYSPYAFIDAESTVLHTSLLITRFIEALGEINEEVHTVFNDTKKYNDFLVDKYKNVSAYTTQKQKLKDIL